MNYARIARAIEFYSNLGYIYIDLPWVADFDSITKTAPEGSHLFPLNLKVPDVPTAPFLVASAEQSFIMLAKQGKLSREANYVACTPCFRSEPKYDELHQLGFMKVELFSLNNYRVHSMVRHSGDFFVSEGAQPIDKNVTGTSMDWYVNDIEVGSYYLRKEYSCGTGLAEPRFTKALRYVA